MFGKYIKLESKITETSKNIVFSIDLSGGALAGEFAKEVSGTWRVVKNCHFKDEETGRNIFLIGNNETEKIYLLVDENGEFITSLEGLTEEEAIAGFRKEYDEYTRDIKTFVEDLYDSNYRPPFATEESDSVKNMRKGYREDWIIKMKRKFNAGDYEDARGLLELLVKDENACAKNMLWLLDDCRFYKYNITEDLQNG